MSWLLSLFGSLGLSQSLAGKVALWVPRIAIAIVALGLVASAGYLKGRGDQRARMEAELAKANLAVAEAERKASAMASRLRVADALMNAEQEEAMNAAIDNPRADDSGDAGVRLACERLRQAGRDTSALPACGGR